MNISDMTQEEFEELRAKELAKLKAWADSRDEDGNVDERFDRAVSDMHIVTAILAIAAAGLLLLMVVGVVLLIWGC